MKTCRSLKVGHILILVLFTFFLTWFVLENAKPDSCTIFTASQGEAVLYGNNEDWHNPDPMIGFFPPSSAGYGSVHFGIRTSEGHINYEGAVNDQGLAWDINSTPKFRLNPHPEKPYYLGDENFLTRITKQAASVEDAIQLAKQYKFGDTLNGQIHIADSSGDAVVISAGADGEIAFTRKQPGDGYLLSTNFNLAVPEKGPVDFRYGTAGSMLDELALFQVLTPEYAGKILDAVHLKTLTTHTMYSNVYDLVNGKIYLYYMSQYGEVVELDMAEELAKGQRVVEMRSLFSTSTAQAGDASYRRFEIRFKLAQYGVILTGLALAAGAAWLVVKVVRRRKSVKVRWSGSAQPQY